MQVKIDTKEKFHVITPNEPVISATMTDGIDVALLPYLQNVVKNVVLNMSRVEAIDAGVAQRLIEIQQKFYESSASFVVCELQQDVEDFLAEHELLELLNVTPTESEAWDILQMEEVERELLDHLEEEE